MHTIVVRIVKLNSRIIVNNYQVVSVFLYTWNQMDATELSIFHVLYIIFNIVTVR